MLNPPLGLTYDDVLLVPRKSSVLPGEVSFQTRFTRNFDLSTPLVAAAMDTVTEARLAIELGKLGGVGVLHRNNSIEVQVEMANRVRETLDREFAPVQGLPVIVAAAVGFYGDAFERAERLADAGVNVIVVDTAHAHSSAVLEMVAKVKSHSAFDSVDLVTGNIATASAARDLMAAGVDALKVGIGPGSICTTRIVSGVGVPQLSAVAEVYQEASRSRIPIIADGGINYSGDIAKAIVAGADTVMLGSKFAGTEEAPGEVKIDANGQSVKLYRGMGSLGVMARGTQSFSKDRYFAQNSPAPVPEGVEGTLGFAGSLASVVEQMLGGLRQSMFYLGAKTLTELREHGEFVRVSPAGIRESHPHDLLSSLPTSNYQ